MADDAERTIPVVVSEPIADEDSDEKRIFGRGANGGEFLVKQLPVTTLGQRISGIATDLDAMVANVREERQQTGLRLTEVTVQLEVTAEGGVNLIGTATVGASAGITLTFAL